MSGPAAAPQNPWLGRRVIAYAHQGGAWEGPSSTLHAIAGALDAGATGIELDVHATRDRHLVVSHDATVDRTTDGHGAISSLTLEELRRLDNAYWWAPGADVTPDLRPDQYPFRGRAPADRRFGVVTLVEVLEAFPDVVLNLDIKQTAPVVEPYEAELASLLRRFGRTDDVIVASFLDAATDAFSVTAPDVPTSAGTLAVAEFYRAVRAGEEPRIPAACGPPGADHGGRPHHRRRLVHRLPPMRPAWPCTCGRSRTRRRWSDWPGWASTASSPTVRRPWSESSTTWAAAGIRCRPPDEVRSVEAGGQPGL